MPRPERPDDSPDRQPKPSWGPGRNAALSVAAFAAIFGAFAYVERDARIGHASVTHDIAGVIGNVVGKYRQLIVAATGGSSRTAAPAGSTSTVAQAGPVPPSASTAPAVSAPAEPAVPPQATARSDTSPPRAAHLPPTKLAASPHAASTGSRTARPGDAHRTSRSQALARTRKHPDPATKRQSQSSLAGTPYMETARVTHDELEGARALAKARRCAEIDEWSCVEQNASRALAIDPTNSESRALLGQAIRNRL